MSIANVDLSCAIRLDAFMHGSRSLPVRGTALATDTRPVDRCGRRRSRATFPEFRKGKSPGNAGKTYPADPPTDEEFAAILEHCTPDLPGARNRSLFLLLRWSGLRISEALDLIPDDLHRDRSAIVVRKGKGGKFGISGMAPQGWDAVTEWLEVRAAAGFTHSQPVFPVVWGPTRGSRLDPPQVRTALKTAARNAGVTRRVAPHQLRHALAIDLNRRGVQLPYISRQLRHSNVGTTATYLSSISNAEVLEAMLNLDWSSR
jgi:site-specific recombinase XerD